MAIAVVDTQDRLIKLPEVIRRVGMGKTTFYQKIRNGTFPRQYKLSAYTARWSEKEVVCWAIPM
jgi:prophage regulatory protein